MPAATLLLILLGVALLVAAITDLRARIIPNRLNLAIALAAPFWWWAIGTGGSDMLLHLALSGAALVFFGALFALGMMGGGDVKLIAALALWLPPYALFAMLVWMAVGGGILTLIVLAIHALRRAPGRPEVPYGVAIVAATLLVLANEFLTVPVA